MKFRPWFVLWLILAPLLSAQSTLPSLVLEGTVTSAQNKTYIDVPFQVPEGVHRISVDFSYTGREQHTAIDLGIADPYRFRGASGGNKSHFTISKTDATPSYLPGEIPSGRWKLILSVPNIRVGVVSHYRAEIRFKPSGRGPQLCARTAWRMVHAGIVATCTCIQRIATEVV